jgi:hypothetical protein
MTSEFSQFSSFTADIYGGSFTAFFQHGLLMVDDVDSQGRHDSWNPASEVFHLDNDSLYVAVQSDVDGPVRVDFFFEQVPGPLLEDLVQRFDGRLHIPSLELRVHDSDDLVGLRLKVLSAVCRVTVFVNDSEWIDRVVLQVIPESA